MNTKILSLIVVATTLATPSTFAVVQGIAADEVITGLKGKVVVGEFNGEDGFGHYLVDVLDEATSFSGFAVSSDAPNAAAFREGWEGTHFTMQQWNAGVPVGTGASLKTTDIGSFSSLFGSSESGANLYYGSDQVISDSSDHDQVAPGIWDAEPEFVFFGNLASHFVAFGRKGGIIDLSFSTPDHATSLGLMGFSLAALVIARRRNR